MTGSTPNPYSFIFPHVHNRDSLFVVGLIDELAELGHTDSEIIRLTRTPKQWAAFDVEWSATRVVARGDADWHVYVAGPYGNIAINDRDSVLQEKEDVALEEHVDPTLQGPWLRDMRFIGNHLYVVGMGRKVYRREGRNRWVRWDAGCRQDSVLKEKDGELVPDLAGFNSIDGLDESDMYAVGFGGQIWRCLNGTWEEICSPTNLMFNKVKMIEDDSVFVAGKMGLIFWGCGSRWREIEHEDTENEIWDLEWFNDKLYVATSDRLYTLTDMDRLKPVVTGKKRGTFGHLHANDGVLLSVGSKHVLWTEDGRRWHDITP